MPRTGMPRYAICLCCSPSPDWYYFWKKRQHQNQDWTKSFSNLHFSTLFQIELEKKNNNQNQDSTKAAIFFSTFSSGIWKETTTTKTKILRVKMIIFNFLAIRLEFPEKSNAKNRYAAVCHLFVLFTVARLKLFWEKRQHQNHNSTKSSKIWFFNTFSSRIWAEKNAQPKPRFGQKVPFFQHFFK